MNRVIRLELRMVGPTALMVLALSGARGLPSQEPGPVQVLTEDGAWCWFQDPRAVRVAGERDRTYAQWVTRGGELQVGAYDHRSGETEVHTLRDDWGRDDHNVGAFVVLPDRRLMTIYARHNKRGLFSRTTVRPEDLGAWGDEVTVSDTPRITYAHPVYLSEERRFYVFWRGPSWKPTFATSADGRTWSEARVLIQDEGRAGREIRPYVKITSDGVGSIHVAFTDGHPRNEPQNSLYYLHYRDGAFHRADGSRVGDLRSLPIQHREGDRVYDGEAGAGRAWVWDIAIDEGGRPVVAYTRLPSEDDHRYCIARWTGKGWHDVEITPGGGWFPQTRPGEVEREPHYSGGMAIDHADPSTVYVSRPIRGTFEIEKWASQDGGRTWSSTAVTRNSEHPNVRPVVPRGDRPGQEVVLWMFGPYVHYTEYRTGIRISLGKQ